MCVRECQWSFSIECKIASELSSTTTEERRGRTCWWYLTVDKQERSLNVAEDSNTCWLAATLYILIEVSEVCKSSATAQFTFSLCCCFTNPTELRAWLFLTFFSFSLLLSFSSWNRQIFGSSATSLSSLVHADLRWLRAFHFTWKCGMSVTSGGFSPAIITGNIKNVERV